MLTTDIMVTIDVKSLYTNIPHTEGIVAITRMMEDTGLDTLKRMFICNLAHQVLTKNYFQFNGIQKLKLFMELLNNHHPTIKFSYEHSQQEIPFLDTLIYRTRDNQLFTKVYHK